MRLKRIMGLLLALVVLGGLALPVRAEEQRYCDIEGHYAAEAIETWSGRGVLQGCGDGTFRPDGVITRGELAAVLNRVMGYQDAAENTFADLRPDQWYTDHLLRLARQGIFRGDEAGRINPEAPITRQETFVALARSLALGESDKPSGFADDGDIPDWARGYVSAMKEAGYIYGGQDGNIRPNALITRAEVVTILDRMAAGFIHADGTYSEDCSGNLFVNAKDVILKDMCIEGDLVITDGVGDGDVTLDKVVVEGNIILRGCGENSFHILPGCEVKDIIVTKNTGGMIRLVNSSGRTIPMVYINDGQTGVVLDGDALGSVIVNCETHVVIRSKTVQTVSIAADAKVTVEKDASISRVEVGKTAQNASLTINGKVGMLVNDAKIKVEENNSSVGGSSAGGAGGGSSTPTPPSVTEIAEVRLQLLPPSFGGIPDTADVLGAGYTAQTQWFNADGSSPSYLWKPADSDAKDAFTADQSYQAVITLSPVSGYAFAENLAVCITDGKDSPTTCPPTRVDTRGDDRVVTMVYNKTESRDPVSAVAVVAPAAVGMGGTVQLQVSYLNNRLTDPDTFAYQWYRCDNAEGGGKTPIPEAASQEYTVPAGDTLKAGKLYYCCEITVLGKGYLSPVKEVEVSDALDVAAVPTPIIGENPVVQSNGRWLEVAMENLLRHKDVSYSVSVSAQVKRLDGTPLIRTGILDAAFDPDDIQEDGSAHCTVDLVNLAGGYISTLMEQDMAFCYDFALKELTITVTPRLRGKTLADITQTKVFDLGEKGNFYVHDYKTSDDAWQGPPRSMQLVIQSAGGSPLGRFVDQNAPNAEAVPIEKYQHADIIFGRKNGQWMDGYYQTDWSGEVLIWDSWLTGLESGDSRSEVRCAFYADNAPDDGMNVYYIKFVGSNILFDMENN